MTGPPSAFPGRRHATTAGIATPLRLADWRTASIIMTELASSKGFKAILKSLPVTKDTVIPDDIPGAASASRLRRGGQATLFKDQTAQGLPMQRTLAFPKAELGGQLGCALVDERLNLLASDLALLAEELTLRGNTALKLGDLPIRGLQTAVRKVVAGAERLCGECAFESGGDIKRAAFEARRLIGAEGPLALVTFSRHESRLTESLDPLTRLPMRDALASQVADWRKHDAGAGFAVLFIDLDDFRHVNNQHGHTAGDKLLECMASRWRQCLREGDLVARYGGDEFVVLLKGVGSPEDARPIVERLLTETNEPVDIGGFTAQVGASIGMAICDSGNADVEELVDAADRDMYRKKRRRIR